MADAHAEKSNKPPGDAFRQQKLKSWQPIMTPTKVIAIFVAIGVAFIPTGTTLLHASNSIYESTAIYDGSDQEVDCSINDQNEGRQCNVQFTFKEDVDGPIYVYYKLENFYQNHRKYVNSRDPYQLSGTDMSKSALETSCQTSYTVTINNVEYIRNPCGLIANSFFNDEITLDTTLSSKNATMDSGSIAWPSDKEKFKQIEGFKSVKLATSWPPPTCASQNLPTDCQYYNTSSGVGYLYYYPHDDTTQYLYEAYPNQISPIDGVTDQHFMVWMRTAALPNFRKLYGKIHQDFKKGDILTFNIVANFEVDSFDGTKSLVISNLGEFGGKNPYLGIAYCVVGSISLMFAFLFFTKQMIAPRSKATPELLNWN